MLKKTIGSILMILGTSIGAGMLALPVVTAHESFNMSLVLLIVSWILMTTGAFSLLEVNLWLKPETNMVSMADRTLGGFGKAFTWLIYLLLLYSLICAYLSGLSDILQGLLSNIQVNIPRWTSTILSLLLFSFIVYHGINTVDIINRGLMLLKFSAYIIIVLLAIPHAQISQVFYGNYEWHNSTFMVMLTSFGYAIIIPSLRPYLKSNVTLLKKVVLIGSLLPLIIYALWIFIVQGLIAKTGDNGLISMMHASNVNTLLMQNISEKLSFFWISTIAKLFISICAITSFLGVSICLTDFIADGLKISKKGKTGIGVYLVSYAPPLLVVLISPDIFIQALNYAGIWCLILLVIIPVTMLYIGRYKYQLKSECLLPDSKSLILILLGFGLLLVFINLFELI